MAEKTKVRPQDDLYEYVNGDFIKKARIPSDHPSVGGFITLRDNVEKIMLREFQSFANGRRAPDELLERAILLYKKVLDTEGRKKIGYRPLIEKLFNEIAPKYAQRNDEKNCAGGYTRIINLGERRGDAAEVAIIELV